MIHIPYSKPASSMLLRHGRYLTVREDSRTQWSAHDEGLSTIYIMSTARQLISTGLEPVQGQSAVVLSTSTISDQRCCAWRQRLLLLLLLALTDRHDDDDDDCDKWHDDCDIVLLWHLASITFCKVDAWDILYTYPLYDESHTNVLCNGVFCYVATSRQLAIGLITGTVVYGSFYSAVALVAERFIATAILSVRLSVTRWYCTQTNEDRIMRS